MATEQRKRGETGSPGSGPPPAARPAVVVTDGAGRVTVWSEGAAALFAIPAGDAVGRHHDDLPLRPVDASAAAVDAVVRDGGVFEGRVAIDGGDGAPRQVDMVVMALGGRGPRPAGLVRVFSPAEAAASAHADRLGRVLAAERAARVAGRHAERWWSALRSGGAPAGPDVLDELLRGWLETVRDALGSDTASVLLADDDGATLIVRASIGFPDEIDRRVRIPSGAGMAGRVLNARHPILFPDLSQVQVVSPEVHRAGLRSAVAAPLVGSDRALGVVHAGCRRLAAFNPVDAEILDAFADRLAVAVENALALVGERAARAEAEAAADRLARLQRITARLSGTAGVDDVARVVLAELGAELGGGDVSRLLWLRHGDSLVLARAGEAPLTARSGFATLAVDGPSPGAAAVRARRPLYYPSRQRLDEDFPAMAGRASLGESFALLPLVVGDQVLGLLAISYGRPRSFDTSMRGFLEAVANQCAQALDRARGVEAERDARRRLTVVAEATRLLGSSLDPAAVLDALVDLVVGNLADICQVMVPTARGLERVVVAGTDPETTARIRAEPVLPPDVPAGAAEALRTGRPELIEITEAALDGLPLSDAYRAWLLEHIAAVLAVPITARGETIGIMNFLADHARGGFGPAEVELAVELAARAGVALDNARRFQREHDAAEILQRAVLPERLPEIGGLRIDAVYRAGATGSYAGGDWYDAMALPDGRLFVSVGDVMGKGPAAAALMGQLRAALRVHALAGAGPGAALVGVDELFAALGEDRLVTAVTCVVDPSTGEVRLASAGHPPPLLVADDGRHRLVDDGRSLLIGAARTPARHDHHLVLDPGDTLVFYSDGLVERRGEPLDAGLERLAAAVVAAGPPTGHGDGWAAALAERLGVEEAEDDVVVLSLHRPSAPTEPVAPQPAADRLSLEARLGSVPEARRWVRDRLGAAPATVVDTAVLLTSELVTNAVLHAGTPVEVTATVRGSTARVEVADGSAAVPSRRRFDVRAATGRGLVLVDELASRWGVDRRPTGKVTWVEVDDPAASPPGPAAPAEHRGEPQVPSAEVRTMVLLEAPVVPLIEAAQHYEGLQREMRLLAERSADPSSLAGRLRTAMEAVSAVFAAADAGASAAFEEARTGHVASVDLRYHLPASVGRACEAYDRLLDEAESQEAGRALLGPPPPPAAVAVRKWLLREFVRQAVGGEPVPWPHSIWARQLAAGPGDATVPTDGA